MIILSHRGYWKEPHEKNTRQAFVRSFALGYGTETDVRDCAGKLVIAHDMPRGDEILFEELLQIMDGRNLPLAINIKADGLGEAIAALLDKYGQTNTFTFDMSIPDMVVQLRLGLPVFTGYSDILPTPVLFEKSQGVWLDCFNSDWYSATLVDELIENGKKVCIVSADLHKRNVSVQWNTLKKCKPHGDSLMLCTDRPEAATEFFHAPN